MIKPTIGRVVLYWPPVPTGGVQRAQPHPALIAHVWNDNCINIGGFDQNGVPFAACSVMLYQGDDSGKPTGQFAEWMPYQKAQAEKNAA